MNNYRIISDIGSGAYSTVHKAIDVNTGHIVAIKKISQQNMNIKHIINRQVTFLHQCINHPNIIQLYKCFSLGNFTYLIFQYMPMDLISFYKSIQQSKKRNLNQEEVCYISFQLFNALKFLHQKGIMHRDIKPQNILIDPQNLTIKLIDFGFAKQTSSSINTNYMVTRWYRPLQIVLNLPYNQNVDVFATGALMLELYLGHQIFRSSSNIDQFYWIVNICGFPYSWPKGVDTISKMNLKNQQNPPQLKDLMKQIRPLANDLISKMLKTSPQERISIIQAFDHPYFSRFKIRSNILLKKQVNFMSKTDDSSINKYQIQRNIPLARTNRAFSTDQMPNLQHALSYRQPAKLVTQKSEYSEDKNSWEMINSGYLPSKSDETIVHKTQYTMDSLPKKQYITRVSQQKNQNLQAKQSLKSRNNKPQPQVQDKVRAIKNRVKSLNQQGINVVSLKKLKIHRQIQNQKSKQKASQYKQEPVNAIKLNPRKQRQKQRQRPMFHRVKDKINEGRLYERGQNKKQLQRTTTQYEGSIQVPLCGMNGSSRKVSKQELPSTKISSAAIKLKKMPQYKEYQFKI